MLRNLFLIVSAGLLLQAVRSAEPDVAGKASASAPKVVRRFVEAHCLECHDSGSAAGGLDLETLRLDLSQRANFDRWLLIHDRVRDGEMPPPDGGVPTPVAAVAWSSRGGDVSELEPQHREQGRMLQELATHLVEFDAAEIARSGRAKLRRLNRLEYENSLQQVRDADWLQVADSLPEDGVEHLFNYPLPNFFMSMLQQMGIETDTFASSTGTMRGLEF